MNHQSEFPLPLAAEPLPARAASGLAAGALAAVRTNDSAAEEIARLLRRLLADESALYAITREWRYDAMGRKFVRLHTLLDEQFSEIGVRLARLAARSRDLELHVSTGHGGSARCRRSALEDGALEAHIVRELLKLHEALLVHLQAGKTIAADHARENKTTGLLAELIASHEKDAFMLRALLWEVNNCAA